MFKTTFTSFRFLFVLILFLISCTTQSVSNKTSIAIELYNGKDLKLTIPPILRHRMNLEYSDYSGSNYINIFNKYTSIYKNDTIDITIQTAAKEIEEINCEKKKDSLTADWAEQKIRAENRFAKSFSSEIIYRNNIKLICTYYNSGCNVNGFINNDVFRIDIRHCKDEKLNKEIIESLTIE